MTLETLISSILSEFTSDDDIVIKLLIFAVNFFELEGKFLKLREKTLS